MKRNVGKKFILFSMISVLLINSCAKKDSNDDTQKLLLFVLASSKKISVKDLNNDGFSDLAIGAPDYDTDRTSTTTGNGTGRVYVLFGSSNGIQQWNLNTGTPTAQQQIVISGEGDRSYFGTSLAYADVNADKITDLLVSAPGYNNNNGRVYVYYGNAAFTSNVAATIDGSIYRFGEKIAVGDLNADTFPDLIVASSSYTSYTGRVYIYNGTATGLETTPSITLNGEQRYCSFGNILKTADLNGDNIADLIVSAPNYDPSTNTDYNLGRVYIYYGSTNGISTTPSVVLTGEQQGNQFGRYVATGDLNNDKIADLVIGTPGYDTNLATPNTGDNAGRIYVYLGSTSGVATAASVTIDGPNTWIDYGRNVILADINNDTNQEIYSAGRIFSGVTDSTATMTTFHLGTSNDYSSTTADINGDGYTDLILTQTRQVTIYYGNKNFSALPYALPLDSIIGENGSDNFGVLE